MDSLCSLPVEGETSTAYALRVKGCTSALSALPHACICVVLCLFLSHHVAYPHVLMPQLLTSAFTLLCIHF